MPSISSDPLAASEMRVAEHVLWRSELCRLLNQNILAQDELFWALGQLWRCHQAYALGLTVLMGRSPDPATRERLLHRIVQSNTRPHERFSHRLAGHLRQQGVDPEIQDPVDGVALFVHRWLEEAHQDTPSASAAHLWSSHQIARRELRLLAGAVAALGFPNVSEDLIRAAEDAELDRLFADAWRAAEDTPDVGHLLEQVERTAEIQLALHESLYDALLHRRLAGKMERINAKRSLIGPTPRAQTLKFNPVQGMGLVAYRNVQERIGLGFHVEHMPFFKPEVVDPRIVRVYPGQTNERHKHAHETVYCVLAGEGEVSINRTHATVQAGDVLFIPRWAMHQAKNTSDAPLVILAVTDYNLTGHALMDKYLKHARMDKSTAELSRGGMQTRSGRSWAYYRPILQKSLALIRSREPAFAERFFVAMFDAHPELRLLDRFGESQRGPVFQLALEGIIDKIDDTSWFHQTVRANGRLLAEAGITEPMIGWARDTAARTLRSIAGEDWTGATAEAWREALDKLAEVLLAGADGVNLVESAPAKDTVSVA